MERVAKVIEEHCTFPLLEQAALLRRVLFCFLCGNEDMHLKNFSLIVREEKVEIAPAYDLVNSFIALPAATEELALPLNGKKRRLSRQDLIDVFGRERLGLNAATVTQILDEIARALPSMRELIGVSFLSDAMKGKYARLLDERAARLGLR